MKAFIGSLALALSTGIFCSRRRLRRRLYGHLNLIHEQAMFSVPTDKVSTFKQFLPKSVFELILEIHRF